MDASTDQVARERIARIFRYLKALNEHRNPPKRQIADQPWHLWLSDLPDHPGVVRGSNTAADPFLLKICRPSLSNPPVPPEHLSRWIAGDLEDPHQPFAVREPEQGADDDSTEPHLTPEQSSGLERYAKAWTAWARTELPARAVMKVFEALYELHGRLDREAERIELVVGDGVLSWQTEELRVFHPVLLQRLQLRFDPGEPAFILQDVGREPELYSALLRALPGVEPKVLARAREELLHSGCEPLGGEATDRFLKTFVVQLSPRGVFVTGAPPRQSPTPRLGRAPVLFLRTRTLGFATALDGLLDDLPARTDLPPALLKIVGIDPPLTEPAEKAPPDEPGGVLFSKPANPEQVRIATQLDQHGCVLVQGPPGTGKTHTIANLIGHLLASGQSILVTSHTTKALRVVRDHVVEPLRPLCVSLLESDLESRGQLEQAVTTIIERLTTSDASALDSSATSLMEKRLELLEHSRALRAQLFEARANEYRVLTVGQRTRTVAEASRLVVRERDSHAWLPLPVTTGAKLPLTAKEVDELYASGAALSADDELEWVKGVPRIESLVRPEELDQLVLDKARADTVRAAYRAELWDHPAGLEGVEYLDDVLSRLQKALGVFEPGEAWRLSAIESGRRTDASENPWESLVLQVEGLARRVAMAQEAVLSHAPQLSSSLPLEEQLTIATEILTHLEQGKKLNTLSLLARPSWKRWLGEARVASGEPKTTAQVDALVDTLRLRIAAHSLESRWDRQVAAEGGPAWSSLGRSPETAAAQFGRQIHRCLRWYANEWLPLEEELERLGLQWKPLLQERRARFPAEEVNARLRETAQGPLLEALTARRELIHTRRLELKLEAMKRAVGAELGVAPGALRQQLVDALQSHDAARYRKLFERVKTLHAQRPVAARRKELLNRLAAVAPRWSAAVEARTSPHDDGRPPGPVLAAWEWAQLATELERRRQVDTVAVQAELDRLSTELRRVTASLIEQRAWAAQVRRTTPTQQRALVGWLDTVRRMGKGQGKRVPRLLAEASQKMTECREAVPVWIMPLTRAVETFDATTRFDVVICDEASQADVMALIPFYMARQVVVVGDHEQVSPSAVGQDLTAVQHLIDEHLEDIPNAVLYDGQMSVYDLARQSFGGSICLSEHFRCVPDVIAFSNHLCYSGNIRALRDPGQSTLRPHVVSHRVQEGHARKDVNPSEAREIASLIQACIEQPEYEGKTFGVISLVGDEQALQVEKLLLHHLSPAEFEARRILCGNAAQFQGDERDVMFLSLVDSGHEGPLRLRAEPMFKQRYNVATSRARDQMWVVHSLTISQLKPKDLRRHLLHHAEDPGAMDRIDPRSALSDDAGLRQEVQAHLEAKGFRVRPRYRVGGYTIDLVVEGEHRKLGIDCLGGQAKPLEELREDLSHQSMLERLGWSFCQVRASEFYLDPKAALAPTWKRLEELDIQPLSEPAGRLAEAAKALHERVLRRAAELRNEWQAPPAGRDSSREESSEQDTDKVLALPKKPRTRKPAAKPRIKKSASRS
jgi:hypothetical protein